LMFSPGPESETVQTAKGRHALLLHASIGGIAVKTGASAVLVESAVMDCESTFATGGGVFAYDGANVTLQGARIERCRAIYAGGMRPSLSHVGPSVAWLSPV